MSSKGDFAAGVYQVYRLEIKPVMLVFQPTFVNCCPSILLSVSTPPPLPCVNKLTVYTYTVCNGGGGCGSGPQTDKHLPQSPLKVNFLDDDILLCLL